MCSGGEELAASADGVTDGAGKLSEDMAASEGVAWDGVSDGARANGLARDGVRADVDAATSRDSVASAATLSPVWC